MSKVSPKSQKKRATQTQRIAQLERAFYNQYMVQQQLVRAVRMTPSFWIARGYSYMKTNVVRIWKKYIY